MPNYVISNLMDLRSLSSGATKMEKKSVDKQDKRQDNRKVKKQQDIVEKDLI